jgi:hypothetical protein
MKLQSGECLYAQTAHGTLTDTLAHLRRRFIKGDIQSADLVVHVLEQEQIDTVMHFAAQTHVDNSFGNSMAFTMNNTWVQPPLPAIFASIIVISRGSKPLCWILPAPASASMCHAFMM